MRALFGWLVCLLALPTHAQLSEAQVNYMLQCQGCHQADGSGRGEEVPDFRTNLNQYLKIPGGRQYLVQVPGSANAPLSAGQLADVLNWIVTDLPGAQPPADFQAFTVEEVALYKSEKQDDVAQERRRLLKLISGQE